MGSGAAKNPFQRQVVATAAALPVLTTVMSSVKDTEELAWLPAFMEGQWSPQSPHGCDPGWSSGPTSPLASLGFL